MKTVFTLLVVFMCGMTASSQKSEPCPVKKGGDRMIDEEDYSHSIDPEYLASFEPVVINIFFWGINRDDSLNEPTVTEESALQNVANINKEFNQFNIFFKYLGYDNTSFNSTAHYVGSPLLDIWTHARDNDLQVPNAFNVYVPGALQSGGGQALGKPSRILAVNKSGFNAYTHTILHELGHCLGLEHTEEDYDDTTDCERVTRNPADIAFNADSAGDFVVDTAAKPRFLTGGGGSTVIFDLDLTNCVYIGNGSDCGGTPYQIFEDDVRNYMSKGAQPYPGAGCNDRFSVGQKIRMLETIELDAEQTIFFQRIYPALTTVASLYEPYDGDYTLGGGFPNPPTFQPGFDYEFVECSCSSIPQSCDDPLPYLDTSFQNLGTVISTIGANESNFSNIVHPNHTAIVIEQLDDPQPRRCWDNNSSGPSPIGGSIIRFKDDLFNLNISRNELNATQVLEGNFLRSLEKGLYKVEIYYDNGTVNERVIYIQK
ncbi:MAG: hypothetical protein Aureis2KO_03200 [Aureisphaera sp.]